MEFPVAVAYEHHKTKTKTDPATGRPRDVREYYATAVTPKPRAGEPPEHVIDHSPGRGEEWS